MNIFTVKSFSKFCISFFCLVFITVGSVPGIAETEQSIDAIKQRAQNYYYGQGGRKNIGKAFRLYLKAAVAGDSDAMLIVGGMYMKGLGTIENRNEGFRWLYKAAAEGRSSKESERIIGQFLLAGEGVPQNFTEAVLWYERAADSGDEQAQSELAYLYFAGDKVERDYDKAYKWFKIAADGGYALAQYNMGILWFTGNGVSGVDLIKAYSWFSLASANGHGDGEIAKKYLEGKLSVEELRRAQDYSSYLYKEIESLNK